MVDYVGQHEYVRVADLVDRFAVSEVTIRGDLAAMHRRGRGHAGRRRVHDLARVGHNR
jgi:DeoR/GlpR family transcriptional regulator of sugar metabolism